MKNSRAILVLLLLLIVCVIILIYPFASGMTMNTPVIVVVVFMLVAIFVLAGCIALLAGLFQQKRIPKPEPQISIIEAPKAEPSHPTEETFEEKPIQTPVKEASDRGSKIIDIEGIGPVSAAKLNAINIYTTSDLLDAGATPLGRKELAEKTGIAGTLILEWVNLADLFRIKGVGEEYSDLLEEAGVDTVVELAKRVPENLHAKMLEVNAKKKLVRRPPTLNDVTRWIEEAKTLQRKLEY